MAALPIGGAELAVNGFHGFEPGAEAEGDAGIGGGPTLISEPGVYGIKKLGVVGTKLDWLLLQPTLATQSTPSTANHRKTPHGTPATEKPRAVVFGDPPRTAHSDNSICSDVLSISIRHISSAFLSASPKH
jgi:hypothetical protein